MFSHELLIKQAFQQLKKADLGNKSLSDMASDYLGDIWSGVASEGRKLGLSVRIPDGIRRGISFVVLTESEMIRMASRRASLRVAELDPEAYALVELTLVDLGEVMAHVIYTHDSHVFPPKRYPFSTSDKPGIVGSRLANHLADFMATNF